MRVHLRGSGSVWAMSLHLPDTGFSGNVWLGLREGNRMLRMTLFNHPRDFFLRDDKYIHFEKQELFRRPCWASTP